ncbi:hypothetical protein [Roseibium aggregatum]|uniref:Uncharacterized protein n=1 Tax=Roseibium aggregatum TaxID=187304 RepID=A0A939J211_9HYPH|nr:hypothetical protein [Roseibium aggregatum]MBN9672716.1 hypothetical protein [Roseibium aggregatum]
MEEDRPSGLVENGAASDESCCDVMEQIHRELARLDMPCTCRDQLDRTIVAIEAWRKLRLRKELIRTIVTDYAQLDSGIAFMSDLARLEEQPLSAQEMRDHAESLKFLADRADRCARHLTELARLSPKT